MEPSPGNHGAKTTEPEVYPGTQEYFTMEPGSELWQPETFTGQPWNQVQTTRK